MLSRVRALLAAAEAAPRRLVRDEKRIAAAALLIEAARADHRLEASEQATIRRLLVERFALAPAECDELIAAATTAQAGAADLVRFTRVLKDRLDHDERIEIVEMLWEVAYADGVLDAFEANLLRRVGGLLYVPDRERGEARKRVLARLGLDEAPDSA
jgi:uncharacterized tellurite resistance protein B-like protein